MMDVLNSVKGGIASQESLSLYHYDLDPDKEMRTFPTLASMVFNDAAVPPWTQWPLAGNLTGRSFMS
jgi:hypothetical protein